MENKKAPNPRNSYIKFDVAVRDHYGCVYKAMLFSRMLYWFGKKPDGFFKFKRPCKHRLYKQGDSWLEEIGVKHKAAFDTMFSQIVQVYKSRSEYLKAEDKFQGKMFASYTERRTNLTHYVADWGAINEFKESLGLKKVSVANKKQAHASATPSPAPVDNFSEAQKNLPIEASCNSEISNPPALINNNIDIQTNTTPVAPPVAQPVTTNEEEKLSSKTMVEIWNSHALNKATWYPSIASRLCKILHDFFGNCLKTFKTYCSVVASSSFCTGKASNSKFKAFLFWAIKPDVIKTILSGGYGVKAIVSQISMMSDQEKLEAEIRSIDHKILMTEKAIERAKDEVVKAQELSIAEYVVKMDGEKKKLILDIVQERLDSTFPTPDFSERIRQSMYRVWEKSEVEEYARVQLGFCKKEDIAAPQELGKKLDELINKKNSNIKLLRIVEKENEKVKQTLENACEGVC